MVYSFKRQKGIIITNALQKTLKESKRKPNKIWVDKGSEFYNRSTKSWLEKSGIKIYSTHNEGKSVIAKKFIRTLKKKIYKYMISISKNMYIDKLDDIVNKYNYTFHRKIKMKLVDVKSNTHINSSKEINDQDPKFQICDIVSVTKKVKRTVLWYLKGEDIFGMFYEKELKKQIKKSLGSKK